MWWVYNLMYFRKFVQLHNNRAPVLEYLHQYKKSPNPKAVGPPSHQLLTWLSPMASIFKAVPLLDTSDTWSHALGTEAFPMASA